MLDALRSSAAASRATATRLRVTGLGGRPPAQQATLFLGNAGTAMRPLTAALALLAATQGGASSCAASPRMHERPIGDLVDALRPLGCPIDYLGSPAIRRCASTAGAGAARARGRADPRRAATSRASS